MHTVSTVRCGGTVSTVRVWWYSEYSEGVW